MGEINVSASTYANHYSGRRGRLMKREEPFPLEVYGDQRVLRR
jgi:hypothetical protein